MNNTPVALNKKIISVIPKHLQNKAYLETDIDKIMLCLTPKKHLVPKLIEVPKVYLNIFSFLIKWNIFIVLLL